MIERKHSPLPWTLEEAEDSQALVSAADGKPVFSRLRPNVNKRPDAERIENTRFIVRACNSYYKLLEACKAAQKLFEQGCVDRGWKDEHNWIDATGEQIDAAILEAEGVQK